MPKVQRFRASEIVYQTRTMRDISRTEMEHLIDEWVLNERDRRIMKRRMIDGICYEPLAEEFNLSVTSVKNIVYKAQEKIFRHI